MATYLVKTKIRIVRQEGDTSDLQLQVPEFLSLTGFKARLQVRSKAGNIIIDQTTGETEGAEIAGQMITFNFAEIDTAGKNGDYWWEIEISKETPTPEIYTIGFGEFIIIETQID